MHFDCFNFDWENFFHFILVFRSRSRFPFQFMMHKLPTPPQSWECWRFHCHDSSWYDARRALEGKLISLISIKIDSKLSSLGDGCLLDEVKEWGKWKRVLELTGLCVETKTKWEIFTNDQVFIPWWTWQRTKRQRREGFSDWRNEFPAFLSFQLYLLLFPAHIRTSLQTAMRKKAFFCWCKERWRKVKSSDTKNFLHSFRFLRLNKYVLRLSDCFSMHIANIFQHIKSQLKDVSMNKTLLHVFIVEQHILSRPYSESPMSHVECC